MNLSAQLSIARCRVTTPMSDVTPVHLALEGDIVNTSICGVESLLKSGRICGNTQDSATSGDGLSPDSGCASVECNNVWTDTDSSV